MARVSLRHDPPGRHHPSPSAFSFHALQASSARDAALRVLRIARDVQMIAAVAMRRRFGREAPVGTVGRADRAERPLLAGQRIQRLAPEAARTSAARVISSCSCAGEAVDRAEAAAAREARSQGRGRGARRWTMGASSRKFARR